MENSPSSGCDLFNGLLSLSYAVLTVWAVTVLIRPPADPVTREEAIDICAAQFAEYETWPPQSGQVIACMLAVFDEIVSRGVA